MRCVKDRDNPLALWVIGVGQHGVDPFRALAIVHGDERPLSLFQLLNPCFQCPAQDVLPLI